MNAYNEFTLSTFRHFTHAGINTDDFNASSKLEDIYNQTHDELSEEFELPAFFLFEDGFSQGDASDEEVAETAMRFGVEEENLFSHLDSLFIERAEPKVETLKQEFRAFVIRNAVEFEEEGVAYVVAPNRHEAESLMKEYLDADFPDADFELVQESDEDPFQEGTNAYEFKVETQIAQITRATENGYEYLIDPNSTIDNLETLVFYLKQEGRFYRLENDCELYANPTDCADVDEIAAKDFNA